MERILAYIKLTRPANILTAIADILLGFAASGMAINFLFDKGYRFQISNIDSLYWLILSTCGLYGGGVVFNDVFDADLDKVERPERPIPSGMASKTGASFLGSALLLTGIISAYQVSLLSSLIALLIAILALLYDKFGKHHQVLGPLNMGACRSGNLLLGMSVIPAAIYHIGFLALIPIVYIGAITLISRGEVNSINKSALQLALFLYVSILLGIVSLFLIEEFRLLYSFPFIVLFIIMTAPSWLAALKKGGPMEIRKAVKMGVLSLIILDAALAAGFAGIEYGLLTLLLLPLSIVLAKSFAVT